MSKLLYTCYSNIDSANFAISTQHSGGFPIRGGFKNIEDAKSVYDSAIVVVIEINENAVRDEDIEYPDNMEIYKVEDILSVTVLED